MSFVHQNSFLIILIVALLSIVSGRIWSDKLNRGEITDPDLVMKNGNIYKVVNLYNAKQWTDDWAVGSIICFKIYKQRFIFKNSKEIYVSGDRVRFADDEPDIGKIYKAVFPRSVYGRIVMKPAELPGKA